MKKHYIQILTTIDDKNIAKKIASALLDKKMASCIQISGPITSNYSWEDKLESTEEYMCIIKTRHNLYREIERLIIEMHPYEVPEIISTQILDGNKTYLDWMDNVIREE